MTKRHLVLLLIVAFGVTFWLLFRDAGAPTIPDNTQVVQNAFAPERVPAQKGDLITVGSPLPDSTLTYPIIVKGKARGNWYFEGSFPLVLTDLSGTVLAQGYASAQGEWMTTDYVAFTGAIRYTIPSEQRGQKGYLILKKDNPSGEAQFDDSLSIPVTF